jgi:hypothetical protein
MAAELAPLEVSSMPDLARLADEVRATGRPRRLRRAGEDVALLVPAPVAPRRRAERASAPDAAAPGIAIATKSQRRPGRGARPPADDGDALFKEMERRRRSGLSVVERTAGALKRYAKNPPATREEEKAAFAQAVAEEVAGRPEA